MDIEIYIVIPVETKTLVPCLLIGYFIMLYQLLIIYIINWGTVDLWTRENLGGSSYGLI